MPAARESHPAGATTSVKRRPRPLGDAIGRHIAFEQASFHTPGHKGRLSNPPGQGAWLPSLRQDVTELPGLDDLSNPTGVLHELELRAARLWQAGQTAISVNGASAGLAAAMIALSARGSTVLVPRNAHRSIIHGLILSGLFPVWYDPVWDDDWGIWGPVPATTIERLLERCAGELAGLVLVSPTYGGALSDIEAIATLCRLNDIALVVDEAHGAHLLPGSTIMPPSALLLGADVVVHSLHKTLNSLTQTGLLHIGKHSRLSPESLRSALALLTTSSPSYLLLSAIEQTIDYLERAPESEPLESLSRLCAQLVNNLSELSEIEVYQPGSGTDPAHVLIGSRKITPEGIYDFLAGEGLYAEAHLGRGVLLMLGTGSNHDDILLLTAALTRLNQSLLDLPQAEVFPPLKPWRPPEIVQILSPRQAAMMPSEVIPVNESVGRIAADVLAPCPPGTPVVVAGQRIPAEILEFANLQNVRAVIE